MLLIKTLRCRVSVKLKGKGSTTHKPAGPPKPSYSHATPGVAPPSAPSVAPSLSATEGVGSGPGEKQAISAHGTDPYKVAERVYQLMLEEARKDRMRGLN